jgi:hypothetical protein
MTKNEIIENIIKKLLQGVSLTFHYDEIDPTYFDYYHHYEISYQAATEKILLADCCWTNDAATPALYDNSEWWVEDFKKWLANFDRKDLSKI